MQGQIGAEPGEGLLAVAGLFRVVEPGGVLALAGSGQRADAGRVVAVPALQVVGQLGVGGKKVQVQARPYGRRRVRLRFGLPPQRRHVRDACAMRIASACAYFTPSTLAASPR
jgi:hypothetical protein